MHLPLRLAPGTARRCSGASYIVTGIRAVVTTQLG
jgi:hypothetical protein